MSFSASLWSKMGAEKEAQVTVDSAGFAIPDGGTAYVDPAVFAWEQAHFFDSGWFCAGSSSQLAAAGDQRAEQTGSVLKAAGLQPLGMIGVQPHFGPEDPDGAAILAGIVRTALPLI